MVKNLTFCFSFCAALRLLFLLPLESGFFAHCLIIMLKGNCISLADRGTIFESRKIYLSSMRVAHLNGGLAEKNHLQGLKRHHPQLPQIPLQVYAAGLTNCCEPTRCSSKILVYFNTYITILNTINDHRLKVLIYFLAR